MIGIVEYKSFNDIYLADVDGERRAFKDASIAEEWCYEQGAITVIVED